MVVTRYMYMSVFHHVRFFLALAVVSGAEKYSCCTNLLS